MDVWEAIEKRRTVRVFKKGVSEKLLRKIIRAGSRAPSGRNSQPWEFIIVNDPKIIGQIAEHKYQQNAKISPQADALMQKRAYQNSSVVAVCHKKGGLSNVAAWMAAQTMALAATAEGLACVMSTLGGEHKEAAQKLLGLPEGYELAMVLVMGVPESIPKKRGEEWGCEAEREDFSWLHINKFGSRK